MKKLLITGALGHIGSKLIHSIQPGEFKEIRMIDNLSTQRYASLYDLPKGVNYNFVENDILKANMIDLTKDIDVVIHLAAITDASSSFVRNKEVKNVNYEGTKRLAEACIQTGAKILFPSTTSIYGIQAELVDESYPIGQLKPQSPYAEYKLRSEQMLSKMKKENGLRFVTYRFGTIFGKSIGMRFHTAVNKFCWQAAMGEPLTIWTTAMEQKRPYLGVNDAVRSMKFAIANDIFDGDLYNVISSNNTVREIIIIINKLIKDTKIKYVENRIMNQLTYTTSNNKIEKMGFNAMDSIKNGVEETIKLLMYKRID